MKIKILPQTFTDVSGLKKSYSIFVDDEFRCEFFSKREVKRFLEGVGVEE